MLLNSSQIDGREPDAPMPQHDAPLTARGKPDHENDRTAYRFQSCATRSDIPFETANALLTAHGELMMGRLVGAGGPRVDHMLHIRGFWDHLDEFLPPNGRFYLVWNQHDQLVATGVLRKVSDDIGELKHLHVRPAARRSGLGRALVQRRIDDARKMGLSTVLADTFAANTEMPALYDRLGFSRVGPLAASGALAISPELVDHMLFFRLDLAP